MANKVLNYCCVVFIYVRDHMLSRILRGNSCSAKREKCGVHCVRMRIGSHILDVVVAVESVLNREGDLL